MAKVEDAPPIKAAKQWTGRLVAGFFHHDEIKEAYDADESDQGIGKWQTALSNKWQSLSEAQKTKYTVIAEQWREQGPPPEVQRRLVFSH